MAARVPQTWCPASSIHIGIHILLAMRCNENIHTCVPFTFTQTPTQYLHDVVCAGPGGGIASALHAHTRRYACTSCTLCACLTHGCKWFLSLSLRLEVSCALNTRARTVGNAQGVMCVGSTTRAPGSACPGSNYQRQTARCKRAGKARPDAWQSVCGKHRLSA